MSSLLHPKKKQLSFPLMENYLISDLSEEAINHVTHVQIAEAEISRQKHRPDNKPHLPAAPGSSLLLYLQVLG